MLKGGSTPKAKTALNTYRSPLPTAQKTEFSTLPIHSTSNSCPYTTTHLYLTLMDTIIKQDEKGELIEIDLTTGEIVGQEDQVQTLPKPAKYTLERGEMVCHLVRSGCTYKKAAQVSGLPHHNSIHAWLRDHPDFKAKVLAAREDRAEHFRDKIQDIADQPILAKEDIPGYKLKADLYEKLAGWDNKSSYGTKHVEQKHTGALQLIINTGIDRSKDERVTEVVQSTENGTKEDESTEGKQLPLGDA